MTWEDLFRLEHLRSLRPLLEGLCPFCKPWSGHTCVASETISSPRLLRADQRVGACVFSATAASWAEFPKCRDFSAIAAQKNIGFSTPNSGIRLPLTGFKIAKIGKRGFQSQKKHFLPPQTSTLFWGGRKWGFFDSETLFSRFWGVWPL